MEVVRSVAGWTDMTSDRGQAVRPFAAGTFLLVTSAKADLGSGAGRTECVIKRLKAVADAKAGNYQLDTRVADKAVEQVKAFNDAEVARGVVRVNKPSVTSFGIFRSPLKGSAHLCERFIHHYHRFNSNTGWADTTTRWGEILAALSHFPTTTRTGSS